MEGRELEREENREAGREDSRVRTDGREGHKGRRATIWKQGEIAEGKIWKRDLTREEKG